MLRNDTPGGSCDGHAVDTGEERERFREVEQGSEHVGEVFGGLFFIEETAGDDVRESARLTGGATTDGHAVGNIDGLVRIKNAEQNIVELCDAVSAGAD